MKQVLHRALFTVPLAFVLVPACGGEEPGQERSAPPAADELDVVTGDDEGGGKTGGSDRRGGRGPSRAPLLDTRAYPSETLGAVHGEIRITGDVPDRFPIGARKNKECTHHADVEHLSEVIVAADGKLRDVYVYVKSGFDKSAVPPAPEEAHVVDQRGCIYTPHVSAMRAGQELRIRNSDPTNHNVNLKAKRNGVTGNVNMGPGQEPLSYELEREDKVQLKCDIHPWMSAQVHVSEHPWFDVSAADGTFALPALPPGEYVVEAVHAKLGKARGTVTVKAGESTGIHLTFTSGD